MLQEKPNDSCGFSDHFLNQSNYKSDLQMRIGHITLVKTPKMGYKDTLCGIIAPFAFWDMVTPPSPLNS